MRMRICLFFGVTLLAAACLAQRPELRPLDPLTPAEQDAALKAAQGDPRVREALGDGSRLVYVQFISTKRGNANEPRGRQADVMFYRPDANVGVRVLVDVAGNGVLDVVRVPGYSVPIGASDVEIAARIALSDAGVQRLLGPRASSFRVLTGRPTPENTRGNYIEGLRTVGTSPEDPCTVHRCVVLLFNSEDRLLFTDTQIIVDLNEPRVMLGRGGAR